MKDPLFSSVMLDYVIRQYHGKVQIWRQTCGRNCSQLIVHTAAVQSASVQLLVTKCQNNNVIVLATDNVELDDGSLWFH